MKHGTAYIFQQCLCNSAIQPNTSGLLSSLSTSFFLAPCLVTQVFPMQKPSPTSTLERTLWSSPATTHQSWVSSWQRPSRSQLRVLLPDPAFLGLFYCNFFLSQLDHREGRGVRKGLEMKLPQKRSGQLYLQSGKAPRAQQREPHSAESCWDCYQ